MPLARGALLDLDEFSLPEAVDGFSRDRRATNCGSGSGAVSGGSDGRAPDGPEQIFLICRNRTVRHSIAHRVVIVA